ncbi:hypothetical protein [Methylosarcina fibrata]|jgi:hypothetical protein|uniref:hypothetical protein n=1 Tax=Methylosarcina fibrata TaxID=105972 RepID=UPI00036DCF48|nr:hypothetical protein [Methylosarcina fibrata]
MVRLVVLMMMAGWLTGCTQAQRFALEKNAELDACAMKRMTETKISGEQGYLQAHHECHRIVMVQKFSESNLDGNSGQGKHASKDPLEKNSLCWEFVKGLYIDENFPEMRLPKDLSNKYQPRLEADIDAQKSIKARNDKLNLFPNRLNEISSTNLTELYELMATKSTIGHKTLCSPWRYRELESVFGRELKQRQG